MGLDLIDGGRNLAGIEDRLEVVGLEIGNTNGTNQSFADERLHRAPRGHNIAAVVHGKRPVDQEQVQVVQL